MNSRTQDTLSPITNLENIFEGFMVFSGIYLVICLIVFVIWIWSMISMIMLNARFKYFYSDYMRSQEDNEQDIYMNKSEARRETNIEPLEEEQQTEPFRLSRGMVIFLASAAILVIAIPVVSNFVGR